MESGYASSGAAMIYYETTGEGPAVLFLHAGVADSRMWRQQLGRDGYRSIVFDQRGFGRTEWVPEAYANRDDALAVLDHLGVDAAVVVGCSNGGEAALQLAIVAPKRVSALVLVGAAARGWEPHSGWDDHPIWTEVDAAFETGDFDRLVDLDARIWLAGLDRSLNDVPPELLALFREMDRKPTSTEAERNQRVQTLEPPSNEQLHRIAAPTLVVVGEFDLPDLIECAHYLAGRLSEREPVIIPGAAHLPSMDQPEAFNEVLDGFLADI